MNILHWESASSNGLYSIEKKKHVQKVRIIKYLYLNGQETNAGICQWLSISAPTSTGLLNELISDGLVKKRGRGESSGGRKPDLFVLRDNCIFVLAIDIGKYKTEMAIFNNNNENVTGSRFFSLCLDNTINTVDILHKHATELINNSGINPMQLMSIGINMPGLIDSQEGINYTYLYFDNISLKKLLESKLERPVYIENDAKARALAEYRFGLAYGKKDVLVLFLDWGIGLGMILDGKIYRGTTGFAGEFSHINMIENGQLCNCGKQGCLETVASGTALVKLAMKGLRARKSSILDNIASQELNKIEPSIIVEAAHRGDQYAINILGEVGYNLGKGISILIQLFNPELIVLSGKMAEANHFLTTPIQQALNEYCMPQLLSKTSIKVSELGERAGIMASVAIVMEHIFE
jgi:N-acetylglucosamine repressor